MGSRRTRNHTQTACHCDDQQKDAELVHKAGHFLPSSLFLFAVRALPDFISALFTTTAANGNNLIALLMCLDWKNNFFDNKNFRDFLLRTFSHSFFFSPAHHVGLQ